jgi:hypothetical protein
MSDRTATERLLFHSAVVIRRAAEADQPSLAKLAALDSARPLRGETLVALVDGEPWAALSLADGRIVADPFRRSASAVELLRVRARHLRATPGGRRTARRALRLRLRRASA